MNEPRTLQKYADDILMLLGSEVVDIELKREKIIDIVKYAFEEVRPYITDTETLTIPYQNKIHIENYEDPINHRKINVGNVVYVMRSSSPNIVFDYQDILYLMNRRNSLTTVSTDDFARAQLINQVKNTISTDLDHYWDSKNNDLYINVNYPIPQFITIMYTPKYENIEDVESDFWQDKIRKLALGYTKQVLGRIRGKYKLNGAQYDLDSDQLLSEAAQEISEVRSYLDENSDILLPLD